MPVSSEAQQGFLAIHHPELLHKWAHKYGVPKNLPYHVGGGKKHPEAKARLKASKRM